MEGCRCSLHSSALTILPSSASRNGFAERKPFLQGQVLKFPNSKITPNATKFRFLNIRAQASGSTLFSSETLNATPNENSKDENLAFVAGATGRVGSRAVRELLKLGFRVRAGVRSSDRAKALVESVKQLKLDNENAGGETQPVEKLEIVQCDLEKKDQIGSALGNASVVLCCIGASEKEAFDISGPFRIDYLATKNLIEAAIYTFWSRRHPCYIHQIRRGVNEPFLINERAGVSVPTVAKVDHFILLTSLGTNKVGFPAAILNLFWGVLIWKRKAEEALIASGLPYTIVRPGGMERPTDTFKETHNITLSQEDTLFGGLVSNLQVAELMACIAKNRDLSYCKVVEVIAQTTAPLTPMEELLKKIPSQRPVIFSQKESSAVKTPDLAPPKSEEPKPSTVAESVKAEEITLRPLSPYTAYEDLKPPSSPSPTPSGFKKPPSDVATAVEAPPPPSSGSGNDVTNIVIDGVSENGPPQISTHYHSPYPVYDDFKPPTSPSPSPPNVMPPAPPLAVDSTSSTDSSPEQDPTKPKPSPLSPFTMYEDLKPPASPSPPAPSTIKS